VSKESFL
jgi:hypothetical protein